MDKDAQQAMRDAAGNANVHRRTVELETPDREPIVVGILRTREEAVAFADGWNAAFDWLLAPDDDAV